MFCFRKRKQSRPFLTYSEEQFTQLAEAKLYHYQQQLQIKQDSLMNSDNDPPRHQIKCDNIYVKMGEINPLNPPDNQPVSR